MADLRALPSSPPSRLRNRVAAAESPGLSALLSLAVGVVAVAALAVARDVLIPLTLSVLLSFVLNPVVGLLRRLYLPKALAVLLSGLMALGVVLVLGGIIGTQFAQLTEDLPRYASTIEHKVDSVREFASTRLASLANRIGAISAAKPAVKAGAPTSEVGKPAAAKPIPVEVQTPMPSAVGLLETVLVPVISPLATAVVVFVVAIFILWQREDLRDRIIRLFGSDDLHRTTAALDDAGRRLGRYYLSLVAVNTGFGALIGTGLLIIGVPSPLLWGIVAGLLRFIPYVGSMAGAVFPLVLAAAVDPGWRMVIETAGLFLLIEPVLGQVFEPMIYGHTTGLSPVSVVISAIFWGWIWGAIGLLLSMPLTLCLVVLGKHIKRLEFLYVLLGDKPALSPAESLYQRMLAGDMEEALEQAELFLQSHPVAAYYDEVALPALRAAANDRLRGVLQAEQMGRVAETIGALLVELEDAGKEGEEQDRVADEAGVILCVAARGPLDEAVCAILAHLISRRGGRARVVAQRAVQRSEIDRLDVSGVGAVIVSYLENAGSLSPLRLALRRIRHRLGTVRLVAGVWLAEAGGDDRERISEEVHADGLAASLREAIEAALAVTRPRPKTEFAPEVLHSGHGVA